jgi:uncharacterized protein
MNHVGLGIDHTHQYEVSLRGLLDEHKLEISHVSVVAIQDAKSAECFRAEYSDIPIIHHLSGIEPAGLDGYRIHQIKHQNRISELLEANWCLEDIGIWNIGPYSLPYFAAPVLCDAVLRQTMEGVKAIQDISSVPFAAEIPSFSICAGDMSLGVFFQQLVEDTGCKIVLDLSHVYSYAVYHNLDANNILKELPLDSVIEIHIAGGSIHPKHSWRYRDTHSDNIVEDVYSLLDNALHRCQNLRAVTYELGVNLPTNVLIEDFKRIQSYCDRAKFTPSVS